MQVFAMVWSVALLLTVVLPIHSAAQAGSTQNTQRTGTLKQLAAVRGEILKMTPAGKGLLSITVRPARDFQEVTVLARENDLVGQAVGKSGESDLLGLLSDDTHDDETITAAELNQGDIISVIYDPQGQNRVLEIYLH